MVVYKTDLKTWENKGVALSPHARRSGTGAERSNSIKVPTETTDLTKVLLRTCPRVPSMRRLQRADQKVCDGKSVSNPTVGDSKLVAM